MQHAVFTPGSGLLYVTPQQLCFVADAGHPTARLIIEAAQVERPMRAIAAVVTAASFEAPPFVICDARGDATQGMVFGPIVLMIGTEGRSIDGETAETWATFEAPRDQDLSLGSVADGESAMTWLAHGSVRAGAFTWGAAAGDEAPSASGAMSLEPQAESHGAVTSGTTNAPSPPPPEPNTPPSPSPSPPEPNTPPSPSPSPQEPDPNTPPSPSPSPQEPDPEPEALAPQQPPADEMESDGPGSTGAVTQITNGVASVLCSACQSVSSPTVARCRGCNTLLGDNNSQRVRVEQPHLGTLHCSNGLTERLDATLLIGRNPARDGCGPGERAVVVGRDDLTVSRRHLVVRQDGWRAVVTNLKDDLGTLLEKPSGTAITLDANVPTELAPGDRLLFGGSWVRYSVD